METSESLESLTTTVLETRILRKFAPNSQHQLTAKATKSNSTRTSPLEINLLPQSDSDFYEFLEHTFGLWLTSRLKLKKET
eukprot:1405048-Amphidinium_carterae.1